MPQSVPAAWVSDVPGAGLGCAAGTQRWSSPRVLLLLLVPRQSLRAAFISLHGHWLLAQPRSLQLVCSRAATHGGSQSAGDRVTFPFPLCFFVTGVILYFSEPESSKSPCFTLFVLCVEERISRAAQTWPFSHQILPYQGRVLPRVPAPSRLAPCTLSPRSLPRRGRRC